MPRNTFGGGGQWHTIPLALFAQNAQSPKIILKQRRWLSLSIMGGTQLNSAKCYIFPSQKKNPTCTNVTSSSDFASQWNSSFGFVRMWNLHFQVTGVFNAF